MADEVRLALDDALTVDLFAGTLELAHGMPSRRSKICGPKMSTDKTPIYFHVPFRCRLQHMTRIWHMSNCDQP